VNARHLIILGGILNTGFIAFHIANDWSHLGLPHAIILSILAFFSFASFFLAERLLTKHYGKVIWTLFCLFYSLRAFRSVQSYFADAEALSIESTLIFVGCVACVACFIAAMVISRSPNVANAGSAQPSRKSTLD
jgi:hypothetical protein